MSDGMTAVKQDIEKTAESSSIPNEKQYDKIKGLIEGSFMRDWAITIQYAAEQADNSIEWLKWNQTQFAVKDSEVVMKDLVECCKSNPTCSMKLVCEHFNPDYKFVYCVKYGAKVKEL
jgi:ribulose bisphosphate carboxylase small subunit